MDRLTPGQRSRVMAAIPSRDTLPEMVVRKWLHAQGYRFRVCYRRLVGRPDIVLPRFRTLVEVRGCFWHRHGWRLAGEELVPDGSGPCALAGMPKTHVAFWHDKFVRNVRRDGEHVRLWGEQGWNVVVIWECALRTAESRERTLRGLGACLARASVPTLRWAVGRRRQPKTIAGEK